MSIEEFFRANFRKGTLTSESNLIELVREHVQDSIQSPFYSTFREELTRQENSILESKLFNNMDKLICSTKLKLLTFPFHNSTRLLQKKRLKTMDNNKNVLFVGDANELIYTIASQYLRRELCVSVLTTDFELTVNTLLPIADGSDEENSQQLKGYLKLTRYANNKNNSDTKLLKKEIRFINGSKKRICEAYFSKNKTSFVESTSSTTSDKEREAFCLRVIEGDDLSNEAIEEATKSASLVYLLLVNEGKLIHNNFNHQCKKIKFFDWLQSLQSPQNRQRWLFSKLCEHKFMQMLNTCNRIDAHVIALTPLWMQRSSFSPEYWYRRLFTHSPSNYTLIQAIENLFQEHCRFKFCCISESNYMLSNSTSDRCTYNSVAPCQKDKSEESERESTQFPVSENSNMCKNNTFSSDFRMTLVQVSDLLPLTINERVLMSKRSFSKSETYSLTLKNRPLDAHLFALFLVRSATLCRSIYDNIFSFAGSTSEGISMLSASSVLSGIDYINTNNV